jgi:hypothetical protein
MNGSMTRTLAAGLLILSALSGCNTWQTSSAVDRQNPTATPHARALAGESMPEARATGLALLAQLSAYADW